MNRALVLGTLLGLLSCGDDFSADGTAGASSTASGSGNAGTTSAAATSGASQSSVAATSAVSTSASTGTGEPIDPTFSFVVIPDTQNETLNDNNTGNYFVPRVDWIIDNQAALDIRWVLQTGDLCNWDTPTHDQYERASMGLAKLDDAGIPYALAIGNHDSAATCTGGSACPGDVNANLRNTITFNTFFPVARFPTMAGTFEPDKVDNAFHLFRAGNVDWIVISMELWAREGAYEWVGQVLADHPNHNGIVFTHDHLRGDGEINTSNGGYGDNSPKKIFDDVLSQHENLRFIFSGHEGLVAFRQDEGAGGNQIYQFLFNIDDGENPTRIIDIDTEARTIDARVYSPVNDFTYDNSGATVSLTDVDFVQ